jgi:hypothetical protein
MNESRIGKIKTIYKPFVFMLFGSCLFIIALFAYRRPHYNWDLLAYMALVLQQDNKDVNQIHFLTYQAAKQNIPAADYKHLIDGAYRKNLSENPTAFFNTLPFYAVKPLYIGMIYMFYKAGFSLPLCTVLPSIIFYMLIGFLIFYWLSKSIKTGWAFSASLIIMYSGFMVFMARLSTPDCMSAFFLLSAFYFILQKPVLKWSFLFLILSIFVRLDNFVAAILILTFLFVSPKSQLKADRKNYLVMIAIAIVCYFAVTIMMMRPFGWDASYYPSFALKMNLSHTSNSTFSFKAYSDLVISQIATVVVFYHFVFFLLLLWLIVYPTFKWSRLSFVQAFSIILISIIACRFVLYPDLSDRFNIAYYVCFLIIFIQKYSAMTERVHIQRRD